MLLRALIRVHVNKYPAPPAPALGQHPGSSCTGKYTAKWVQGVVFMLYTCNPTIYLVSITYNNDAQTFLNLSSKVASNLDNHIACNQGKQTAGAHFTV